MLEEALRRVPLDRARPEFRAELERRFVAASAPRSTGTTGDAGRVRPGPRRAARGPRPLSSGPFNWQVAVGLAAAAAAVVLIVFGIDRGSADPGPGSDRLADTEDSESPENPARGTDGTGAPGATGATGTTGARSALRVVAAGGVVDLDRARVSGADLDDLTRRMRSTHTVETHDGQLVLALPGAVHLAVAPFSRLDLPDEGLEVFDPVRDIDLRLERGVLRLKMKPDYGGARFVVETPHAKVRIAGTVLSIEVFEEGTCICVGIGTVDVEVLSGTRQTVEVGSDSTCFVFGDGSEPKHAASAEMVPPEHLEPLWDFYATQY